MVILRIIDHKFFVLNNISKLYDDLNNDVFNSLDDGNYNTTVNNRAYDCKNAEKILLKIITRKISKNQAGKLYDDLIKAGIAALEE